MNSENKQSVIIGPDEALSLFLAEDVFIPTGTTAALLEAVRARIKKPGKMLDLGCGIGVLGVALSKSGLISGPIHASDISEKAVACAQKNAQAHAFPIIARAGSLFAPWKNEKFDYIVDDVAGISQPVAEISPWYKGVLCDAGDDGTALIEQIIEQAPDHLNPGGYFFFPAISLSNTSKIVDTAKKVFSQVKQVVRKEWPLPPEMKAHADQLHRLQERGCISFEEKFGLIVFSTEVYVACRD